jgi:MFS family permease
MQTKKTIPSEEVKLKALPWNLVNGMLTNIFYLLTFGGSVFLFFLTELGLPKGQIGTLLSFFPFCGLVALGFAPVASRLGRKKVFMSCFGSRYFVMASLLMLPFLLTEVGRTVGIVFLFGVIIIFAILRALGETAYYPWSQEFIPNFVRGRYIAVNSVLSTIASGAALLIAGIIIQTHTGLGRFLFLIGVGCLIGFIGLLVMWKVPGGEPIHTTESFGDHLANMARAMRDQTFVSYLGGLVGVTVGTILLTSFLPLYITEQIGLPAGTVVTLDAIVMVGGALSSLLWGWGADRLGSRPVLMFTMGLSLLVPLGWLILPRQILQAVVWCGGLYFLFGVTSVGVAIAAGRLVFNEVIPQEKSTAYTAIYYTSLGLSGGISPIFAGNILGLLAGWRTKAGPFIVDGYWMLFLLALILTIFGWQQFSRIKPDGDPDIRLKLKRIVTRIQIRR